MGPMDFDGLSARICAGKPRDYRVVGGAVHVLGDQRRGKAEKKCDQNMWLEVLHIKKTECFSPQFGIFFAPSRCVGAQGVGLWGMTPLPQLSRHPCREVQPFVVQASLRIAQTVSVRCLLRLRPLRWIGRRFCRCEPERSGRC